MKRNRILLSLAISVATALGATLASAADIQGKDSNGIRNHGGDEVGMQLFSWNTVRDRYNSFYGDINNNADLLKKLGITMVWMPPPWRDDSSWSGGGKSGGGEGYFWKDFNLNSRYGTDSSLQTAVSTLASTSCSSCSGSAPNNSPDGIKVIYDMVPNHRDKSLQTSNTWDYNSSNKWIKNAWSAGDGFISGDADVNVYNALGDFLGAMNTLADGNHKAAGWRFDFVRGYDAGLINTMMINTGLDNGFCVGEMWKEGYFTPASLSNWGYAAGCTAFDFAGIERSRTGSLAAVRGGMAGSSDTWTRSRAVHAYDNHDLSWSPGQYGGQAHWPMADSLREPLSVYQAVGPGTPMFYLPYLIDGTNTGTWSQGGGFGVVRDGLVIRKAAGIKANSAITWYNSEGLQFMVQGTQKKVIGLIWTAVGTPNAMNSSYDNSKYTLALSGGWGKIYTENTTTTPPNPDPVNVAPVTVLKYAGTAVTSGSTMNVVNATALTFDGSGSTDTAGQTLSYAWTCDDMATTAANDCSSGWWTNGTASSKTFTPNVNGSYKVALKVTDNATAPLSSTSTVTVNVMTTLPLTSKLAAAYISGTNNSWGTSPMTLTANNLWKATVAFTGVTGNASTGARYKIRPSSSSWTGAYGCTSNCTTSTSGTSATTGGDIVIPSAQGDGSFVLTFNDSTLAWTLTKAATTPATVTAIDTFTNSACSTATGTITEGNTIYLKPTTTGTITSSKFVYGSTIVGSSSSGNIACQAFVVPAVGDIGVSYTANTSSLTKTITVVNAAPTANAGADQAKSTTQTITLSGAASSDVQGGLAKYTWSEGGTEIGLGSSLTLAARAAGTYTFSLVVDDGEGATASDSVVVTVTTNAAPTANAGADQTNNTTGSATVNGNGSTDSDGTISTYEWKEGSTVKCAASSTSSCSLTGLSVALHTLTLTVTDNQGATATDTMTIDVTSNQPNLTVGEWEIKHTSGSGLSMDIEGGVGGGRFVQLYTDNGSAAQKWKFINTSGSKYQIKAPSNADSCLEIPSGTGTTVKTWCHTDSNGHGEWLLSYQGSNTWYIENAMSGTQYLAPNGTNSGDNLKTQSTSHGWVVSCIAGSGC